MRTSRFAIASCTALVGLGALVSQAVPSAAAPPPGPKTVFVNPGPGGGFQGPTDFAPTPPTTKPAPKPQVGDFDLANPVIVDPPSDPNPDLGDETEGAQVQDPTPGEDGECTPGSTVDPDCIPEDDCVPVPGGPQCPEDDDCVPDSTVPGTPDEQCPPDDDCVVVAAAAPRTLVPAEDCCDQRPDGPAIARDRDDCDPCRPDGPKRNRLEDCDPCDSSDDDIARDRGDDCDPCDPSDDDVVRTRIADCDPCVERPEGDTGGGQAVRHGDDPDCPGEGTTGGDDGGTDGPDRGRLPHTGGDIAVFVGAGLGLTGLGTLLRRIGRR